MLFWPKTLIIFPPYFSAYSRFPCVACDQLITKIAQVLRYRLDEQMKGGWKIRLLVIHDLE